MIPTGLIQTWRLWRHCLCVHGWYPILVAFILTAGCIMDLFTSRGCNFLQVEVGFQSFNSTSVFNVGFWHYTSPITTEKNYNESSQSEHSNSFPLFQGCNTYPQDFSDLFIRDDSSWRATKFIAWISAIGGLVSLGSIWLANVCPIPASFLFPGLILPSTLVGFLAGGSKFLFFATKICQEEVWFDYNNTKTYHKAQSCALGTGSYISIASTTCYFITLLLICFRIPKKRTLDENFGLDEEETPTKQQSIEYPNPILFSNSFKINTIPEATVPTSRLDVGGKQGEEQREDKVTVRSNSCNIAEEDDVEAVLSKINAYLRDGERDTASVTASVSVTSQLSKPKWFRKGNMIPMSPFSHSAGK